MNMVRFKHMVTNSSAYGHISLFVKKNSGRIVGTFATILLLMLSMLSVAWWDYYNSIPHGIEYIDSIKTISYGVFAMLGVLGIIGSIIGTIAIWVTD